ncbi:MAG: cAMP-activated global transcriptional regulator CRP [Gammaproteobacteria bacterium]|nr:cAMP-activated global transcriptional regulator CRP [Gammaproteobacteria bacterium]
MTIERQSINQQAIDRFLKYTRLRRLPKKRPIILPGDTPDSLFYIISGSVSVIAQSEDHHEIVLAYLNAGDFIGEMGLFLTPDQRSVTIRTRTECEIAEISYNKLNKLFANELKNEHALILHAVGMHLSKRLIATSKKVTQLVFVDAAGRVAKTLLDLCDQPDAMSHPDGTQIRISRQEIARIVGCSREIVGRILKNMSEEGLIQASGMTIVIHHAR